MDTPGGSYTPPPPPPPPPVAGGTPSGGDLVYPQQPPKDPVLILVLNLLIAGCLGYFMIGQKMKGIVAVIIWVVGLFLTCGAASGLVAIVAAVDGYLQAQQLKNGVPVAQWTFFNDHR
jgi:TM2 domain-containing membrane protein YozV